jgi:tRNA(fMet)-specific endonuclease VapC
MGVIVDTSALIAMERRGMTPDALRDVVLDEPLAMATITLSELLVGIHRADALPRRLQRERFLERTLALLEVLPFDAARARIHAAIMSSLISRGQLINAHDMLIAATALSLEYGVLTHNVRDFTRVPGLVVRQPNW